MTGRHWSAAGPLHGRVDGRGSRLRRAIAGRAFSLGLAIRSAAIALPTACAPADGPARTPANGEARAAFPGWDRPAQIASAEDMRVFDPYIGRFRSKTMRDEQRSTVFHYFVEYRWFDADTTIVRFRVSTVYADDGSEVVNAEGFYGHDPFEQHIYALAAFPWGVTGFGAVGEFDRTTHRRVTWARSMTDRVVTHVRDVFEVVDANTWTDVTWIRTGPEDEWRIVYQDTFTRVESIGN